MSPVMTDNQIVSVKCYFCFVLFFVSVTDSQAVTPHMTYLIILEMKKLNNTAMSISIMRHKVLRHFLFFTYPAPKLPPPPKHCYSCQMGVCVYSCATLDMGRGGEGRGGGVENLFPSGK